MKKVIFILFLLNACIMRIYALPGDTTVVQTFSFEDGRQERRGSFEFPDGSVQYEKVLMYYTLRCDPTQYPACGEWDYIFNTEIFEPTGVDPDNGETIYQSWKLGTYVTPYGYGINLNTGWTWIYDVSDYVHLLKNTVIIQDGNYQELLDLKFVFIEGIPPRDVIGIKKVWDSEYSLQDFDNIVKDTTIHLTPDEVQVKLRTTLTGHGWENSTGCAEFCPNIHSLQVDGNTIHSWDIIQGCASNPLYPQGGTWIYDRAGWCPGMPGTTKEFELTDYITDHSINIDYDVEPDEHGSYRTFIYLVTYGAIKQTDDAAAEMIIAPTDNPLQLRYNPTCGEPIVVIKNLGSNPLNTVDIHYGLNDGSIYTYSWQGDLGFLEKDTVVLPRPDWNEVQGTTGEFWFELLNPNGRKGDPTPYNNKLTSSFKMALVITWNAIQFCFKTNHAPEETTWKLYDVNGNLLYENEPDMLANQTYIKDFSLANGSYKLCLYDSGDDGLYFYPYGTKGSAYLRRPNFMSALYRFEPEFGRFTQLYFAVNEYSELGTKIVANIKDFTVFPNPAHSILYLDMSDIHGKKLSAEIYDLSGEKVMSVPVPQLQVNKIEIDNLSSGTYLIVIKGGNRQIAKNKFIVD